MKRTVLGLDIGIASIGWGLVELDEEKYINEKPDGTVEEKYRIVDGKIIDTGVRSFQIPQDRQKKSLALARGSARRSRKSTRHKKQRLRKLVMLSKEFCLIGDDFDRDKILKPQKGDKESAIWEIRKDGLKRKLTDTELFRAIYHIAKHRGFYFQTTAEDLKEEKAGSEEGKVKAGIARIKNRLSEGGWETVGQMFCEEYKQTNDKNKRKRNAKDNYQNSIHRSLLRDEVIKIFSRQKELGNDKASEELLQQYIDNVLMYQEGINDKTLQTMMGNCEFIPEQRCAPKESYTAEKFMLFNRLNTLELIDTNNKNKRIELTGEQRNAIEALAYKNTKVTFAQIRTKLGLGDDLRFNLCSYRDKNPEYSKKLDCKIEKGQRIFEDKHKVPIVNIRTGEIEVLDKEIKQVFKDKKCWSKPKMYVYYSDIRKQLNLASDFRFKNLSGYTKSAEEFGSEAKYVKQFESKDVFVEMAGFHKIRKGIEKQCNGEWETLCDNTEKLDMIAEALTYCKSDETRMEYLQEHGFADGKVIDAVLTLNMKKLANFSIKAMRELLTHMSKSEDFMLFNEAKKECGYGNIEYDKQAKLKSYSGFFENNPVVARSISQTRKLINAIVRKHRDSHPIDQIHIEVATDVANSEKRKIEIAQGQKRYREDKEAAAERCRESGLDPSEGQTLLMSRLAEEQDCKCPYTGKSISYYPSGGNGSVYIMDCEIDHVIPMSRSFNDSLKNKVLCTQKANQDKRDRIPFEWFEDMHGKDSQEWFEFEKWVKKLHSMPYSKKVNLCRKSWTEEDKERFISRNINDTRYAARHVADYLRKYFDFSRSGRDDIKEVSRIQLRSGGVTAFLRHMWGLNKDRAKNNLHHAMDAIVVACSTYGHVYLVSNLSKTIERKGKNWYKHFGRDKFMPWGDIRSDVQQAVEGIFVSRMQRHSVTGSAHKETVESFKGRPKKRFVKVNDGYADMGPMVRADVFVDEAGKNYMVPIYTVDIFANKPLPDKYINRNDTAYEDWPSVEDGKLRFKFSLYKDDLISVDGIIYYVSQIKGTRSKIIVKNIDGSLFNNEAKIKDIGYRSIKLQKYSVDMLGNYKEIKAEKRQNNVFSKRKTGKK